MITNLKSLRKLQNFQSTRQLERQSSIRQVSARQSGKSSIRQAIAGIVFDQGRPLSERGLVELKENRKEEKHEDSLSA